MSWSGQAGLGRSLSEGRGITAGFPVGEKPSDLFSKDLFMEWVDARRRGHSFPCFRMPLPGDSENRRGNVYTFPGNSPFWVCVSINILVHSAWLDSRLNQ